jgi:hypothetical protein
VRNGLSRRINSDLVQPEHQTRSLDALDVGVVVRVFLAVHNGVGIGTFGRVSQTDRALCWFQAWPNCEPSGDEGGSRLIPISERQLIAAS